MAGTTVKAYSTIGTVLEVSTDGASWEKMCPVKSFPALGGAPEQIEVTDLEDEQQSFVPGVQSMDAMEFGANYTLENYTAVKTKEKTALKYRLTFAKGAGVATWDGQHTVYMNEGEVNGSLGMTIAVSPSSKITIAAAE